MEEIVNGRYEKRVTGWAKVILNQKKQCQKKAEVEHDEEELENQAI